MGLTDESAPGPVPRVAEATEPEIAFLLSTLNRVVSTPIRRDQVRGAFAGLRPLVDNGADTTADVSRRHLVAVSDGGFVTVLGGKLTTYRRMAEDAVDLAVRTRGLSPAPSRSASIRLIEDDVVGRARIADAGAEVAEGIAITRAEIEFAVRAEGAMTVDDVMERRTRIGLVDADRDRSRHAVEEIVAQTLAQID